MGCSTGAILKPQSLPGIHTCTCVLKDRSLLMGWGGANGGGHKYQCK